ncbi:oligosaccharide repeat unit polymerase/O-antigen ligase [Buttiauxella gaviniae ATCC 51604]|uniref:Oligosaccharide repeat unit polymerase/O-antigen ligase n=1 Tax=Buttiauxella gaviniae ATCC 51604 TaxID=1354253 RepID=A0A1B7HZA4_9ENTR|nr:O-antigen ligase RfaL [Buttiauxella gaviniae]OAT21015.1 oligosaccharide repeat unit polymerase/O-antigen ligase [Buttiauxella gaviniae ATCC 51604]
MNIKKSLINLRTESFPLVLVFSFIALSFLPDVTRLKNLCIILIGVMTIIHIIKDYRTAISTLNNALFFSVCFFTIAMIYSVIISIDPIQSLKSINKPVINSLFLFSFLIPIALYKQKPETIAKLIISSFSLVFLMLLAQDLFLYIEDYQNGIVAFTNMSHRYFSDGYVFCSPIALCLWHIYKKNTVLHWVCFLVTSLIMIVFMLGTLARGAWLAALIMSAIIIIINKEKILALLSILLLAFTVIFLSYYNGSDGHLLTKKLEQTDSSYRYKNGTQGTALELIMKNPIKGYGFGNDVYHEVYNQQVKNNPQWVFKQSLGPHNVFLAIWFAAGFFGILAIAIMVASAIRTALIIYNKKQNILISQAALLLITSFFGWLIIRGNVENVYLNILGIHFGLLIALSFSCKSVNTEQ